MANPNTGQNAGSGSTGGGSSSRGGRAIGALGSLANFFRPNFGKDGPVKGGSRITRLIMGTLIFVLVGQLLVTGLYAADAAFKLGLQQPVVKNVSWLTWFFLIYFVALIGLWFGLNKFGFFPRPEPLPPSSRTGTSTRSSSGKKAVTQIPGIGAPRARTRRADAPTAPTSGKKAPPPPPAKVTTKVTTKIAAKAGGAATDSGAYDETYDRVKAAQRLKRRRELR